MRKLFVLFAVAALLTASCSASGGSITQITSLPPQVLTAQPTVQASATLEAPPTATLSMMEQLQVYARQTQAAEGSLPTATPWNNNLQAGQARDIALATDMAYQPTMRAELTFSDNPVSLNFDEFYDGYDMRAGLIFSDKLLALDGQRVVMEGYMAPPLKPELDFFVLTRIRLAFCPFCTTGADWPDDIALIYLNDQATTATLNPVRVTGQIEVGASVDQETGMVSMVRIYVDQLEILG